MSLNERKTTKEDYANILNHPDISLVKSQKFSSTYHNH